MLRGLEKERRLKSCCLEKRRVPLTIDESYSKKGFDYKKKFD